MKRGNGEGSIYYDKSRDRWIAQYICGVANDGCNKTNFYKDLGSLRTFLYNKIYLY